VGRQSGSEPAARAGSRRLRAAALLSLGLLVAVTGFAAFERGRARQRAVEAGDAELRAMARVAEALGQADSARIQALLARLRIELRAQGRWSAIGARAGDAPAGFEPEDRRRLDTLLRRALEGTADLRAIDLVVAGPGGLSSIRLDASGASDAATEPADAGASARALWYASDVERAGVANGRRIARSEVLRDEAGAPGEASQRATIALHDADDVVQGVLVATLDLAPLGERLGALASADNRFALLGADGLPIGTARHAPIGAPPVLADLPAVEADAPAPIGALGGHRRLVQPLPLVDAGEPGLVVWLERDAPASLVGTLVASPWSWALSMQGLLTAALFAWDGERARAGLQRTRAERRARAVEPAEAEARTALPIPAARPADPAATPGSPRPSPERFVLREWLADVRGCLEREAATRGLTLDLRCERALPREVVQDPLWLGGLLVCLGREALDATRASRVALEVSGEPDDGLRFDLDAGDSDLVPAPGANALAARLGAELASGARGRLAIRLPGALAD